MILKRLFLVAALLLPAAIQAAPVDKYFGYFGGDYASPTAPNPNISALPEMQDHINLYHIQNWSTDTSVAGKNSSEGYVLQELAKAKAAHIHAMVPALPFVFQKNGASDCLSIDPDAARGWSSLAQKMVDQGYLIPGDPAHSTVVATYVMDEPNADKYCLTDVNGQVNPAWANAINAIRQNPATATLPLASILSGDGFDKFFAGMKTLDWVGFDRYGYSDSKWASTQAALKSYAPGKKYIVVPGAQQGCDGVTLESTDRYFNAIENDPDVTWIAPFAWFSRSNTCLGVRDLPTLKAKYKAEALKIRDLQCNSSQGEKWFCGRASDVNAAIDYLFND
jgi:hypothetical protein